MAGFLAGGIALVFSKGHAKIKQKRKMHSSKTKNTSLSAEGPKPSDAKPRDVQDFHGVTHAPHGDAKCKVEPLSIQVEDKADGFVPGFLHLPEDFAAGTSTQKTAAILLSGAGGGVVGPSGIYLSMAGKLAGVPHGIPTLRLDYRYPARNSYCAEDVRAAITLLQELYGLERFVLVGWSFGGAPVFTVAADDQRVVACATIASQTSETQGILKLSPRPVLLLHGRKDMTLSFGCSKQLYEMYGENGDRRIHLFDGDDHALTNNAAEAEEMLCGFIAECAELDLADKETKEVFRKDMLEDGERVNIMKEGGDLGGQERIE